MLRRQGQRRSPGFSAHSAHPRRPSLARASLLLVLVIAGVTLVYVLRPLADPVRSDPLALPQHVADMRDAILAAAHSGDIEELQSAFDMNGQPPDLGIGSPNHPLRELKDPIAALKAQSADGRGHEILAALINVLSMPPATQPFGTDIENNLIYVWPYLAERPFDKLTPSEDVDLYRLVTPAKAAEMHDKKRWLWWRLVIAADGTWLSFKRVN